MGIAHEAPGGRLARGDRLCPTSDLGGLGQPCPRPFGLDGAIESVSASVLLSGALARSAAIPTAPNTWSTSPPERSGRASCCWADPIAGLDVVALLVHEGREALNAEHIDDCC
jgi:hypothetical protein